MFRSNRMLAALLACLSVPAAAQGTVSKVTFRNPGPYSDASLTEAARFHSGEKASRDGIQAAAQRLMDTGCFDDVQVDSKGTAAAMEIIFLLKPEDPAKQTPVGFENFVWLTPEELQSTVHKAAPLFQGKLPEAGNQLDAIEAALQAALRAKGRTNDLVKGCVATNELVSSGGGFSRHVQTPSNRTASAAEGSRRPVSTGQRP